MKFPEDTRVQEVCRGSEQDNCTLDPGSSTASNLLEPPHVA